MAIEPLPAEAGDGPSDPDVSTRSRRLLMLVSGYPPARQVVLRAVKFRKYLPQYGWRPHVLTARFEGADAAPCAPEPGVTRVPRAPTPSMLAAQMMRWWRGRGQRSASGTAAVGFDLPAGRTSQLARTLLRSFDTPDDFIGWAPAALWRGRRLAREHFDALYASGPPFSVVLAGVLLSRMTGLPLVSDFRDAWTLDASDPFGTLGGPYRARLTNRRVRRQQRLERWCLQESAAVLFTSHATRTRYAEAYPWLCARMHVIFNGADPDDFVELVPEADPPVIAHVGSIHEYQASHLTVFLNAFAAYRRGPGLASKTTFVLVGPVASHVLAAVRREIDALGLVDSVRFIGAVEHQEAVRWMKASRALVAIAGENAYIRLSKISEYVAAGAPVLALARPETDVARELRDHGATVVDGTTVAGIERALRETLSTPRRSRGDSMIAHPHPLNRRTEAQELSRILDELVS